MSRPAVEVKSSRRLWLLVFGLACLAVAGTAAIVPLEFAGADLVPTVALAVAFAATERWVVSVHMRERTHSLTFSEFPLTLGVYLLNPLGLVLARVVGVLPILALVRRQAPRKVAFNLVSQWLETLVVIVVVAAIDPGRTLEGPAGVIAVVLMSIGATMTAAISVTSAISAISGRAQPELAPRFVRDVIGPNLTTTAFAVSALVLGRVSPWLLWAPVATITVLITAYRSNVRLAHLNDRQLHLLTFTRTTTGRDGLETAAVQVVEATRELPGVVAVGILGPTDVAADPWIAGGIELAGARLPSPRGSEAAASRFEVDGRPVYTWPLDDTGTSLVVEIDPFTTNPADLRRTVDQVANHARVAIANASHAQALREQARDAAQQALTDPLTGLPNRTALTIALERAMGRAEPFATLLLDLDDFKQINDALGHAAGDEVLWEIGRRMSGLPGEDIVIARLGGDEFAAIVPGGEATARDMAARLLKLIHMPVPLAPYSLEVGGSIGISLFPDHTRSAEQLLAYADLSMYEAKAQGGGLAVFGAGAAGQAVRHLAIASTLRTGLAQHQIRAVYQPQIDLRTDRVVGMEALARWEHPDLGAIRPEEFIRVAEQGGLLHELNDAMVDDALTWQRRWAADGFDLQVAVNLSPRSLLDGDLPRRLAKAVDRHGVQAERLTIEITEGSVMSDPTRTRAVLARISELGIKVSIDDFGTGYSSLAYLQELPADEVKIDKSFVLPMAGRRQALPLVSGIIRLCHELGFTVVAEGVEQAEVQTILRGLGCDRGQGFAIARPMDAADVSTWALAHRDRWQIPEARPLN